MKKILFIIASLILFAVGSQAQTTVKQDDVKYYAYDDTLGQAESYSATVYYIDDFATDVRIQLDADSLVAGAINVSVIMLGSLDNVNYFSLGDTVTVAGTGTATGTGLWQNVFVNYLKPKIVAANSAQYVDFSWRLLINKND